MKPLILALILLTALHTSAQTSVRVDTVYSGKMEYIIKTTTDTIGKSYYRWKGSFPRPSKRSRKRCK